MNHIFITHNYNGHPFTFTKHFGYWYISTSQLDECLSVRTVDLLKNSNTTHLIQSVADLYNISLDRVVMPILSDNPDLGMLLIKDLALQIAKDMKPKLRVWLIDRISELTFYKIPFDNIPDCKIERNSTYKWLVEKSVKEESSSPISELFMKCAKAWNF